MSNLYSLFRSRFSAKGAESSILSADREVVLTFDQLDESSAGMAGLFDSLGLVQGDRIIVQVEKSIEIMLIYLGCLRRGIIFIPLNTAYTSNEVDYFVSNAKPALIVCCPKAEDRLSLVAQKNDVSHLLTLSSDGGGSLIQRARDIKPVYDIIDVEDDDIAAILYTSGTTGASKGAMLSHKNLSSNVQALHQIWGWQADDVLLHTLPIFHAHGLFVGVHLALLNASAMIFLPKFNDQQVIGLLNHATVFMGVPTFYTRLLDNDSFTKETCANMRLFISGSAPLLGETFDNFFTQTGHKILERYGMTEATMITSNPLDGERVASTVGFPLPDVQARVVDEQGQTIGDEQQIGQLEIVGPNVFKGYWKMPEKTKEEFTSDGFFRTGDLATIDKEGRVAIVGRSKDLIISGGYNVYPKEIESHIDDILGVKESAVIGLQHAEFGEAVTAVVVLEEDSEATKQIIIDSLKDSLAKFKLPKEIFFVDQLPRNTMSKVQKKQLRDEYQGTYLES
jgi:malonyl-CoA/methylmalonyl-CoA synthetase